jgi:hypothetical protein
MMKWKKTNLASATIAHKDQLEGRGLGCGRSHDFCDCWRMLREEVNNEAWMRGRDVSTGAQPKKTGAELGGEGLDGQDEKGLLFYSVGRGCTFANVGLER